MKKKILSHGWRKALKRYKLTLDEVEMAREMKMELVELRFRRRGTSAAQYIGLLYGDWLARKSEEQFFRENAPEPWEHLPHAVWRNRLRAEARRLAGDFSRIAGVEKVALFGSVAEPLHLDVPRTTLDGRPAVSLWHMCADIDLALWISDPARLAVLEKVTREFIADNPYGDLTREQIDLFLLDAAEQRYLGRLESPGVLRQPEGFLFDIARLDGPYSKVLWAGRQTCGDLEDEDVPF